MDYDIFKLHHPFSMLVAGPRGTGKSEFVKQLLALKPRRGGSESMDRRGCTILALEVVPKNLIFE